MNRPKATNFMKEDGNIFLGVGSFVDVEKYSMALEEYCDVIEKALDKACDMLATYDLAYKPKREPKSTEDWKEWALKDE